MAPRPEKWEKVGARSELRGIRNHTWSPTAFGPPQSPPTSPGQALAPWLPPLHTCIPLRVSQTQTHIHTHTYTHSHMRTHSPLRLQSLSQSGSAAAYGSLLGSPRWSGRWSPSFLTRDRSDFPTSLQQLLSSALQRVWVEWPHTPHSGGLQSMGCSLPYTYLTTSSNSRGLPKDQPHC